MPGVVIVGQVPSIPQSAFADSSLCTREVRWPDGHTVFALARCACLGKESMTAQALGLPSAAAQCGSSVTLALRGGSPPGLVRGGVCWYTVFYLMGMGAEAM